VEGPAADSVCGESFEKKAQMLESKLAPTILSKQAIHAATTAPHYTM